MPGRRWYAVAAGIFVLGMGAFALFLFTKLKDLGSELEQVVVPGEAELALDPGTYTIFHEHQSVVDGRYYSAPEAVPGLRVRVLSAATGEALPVRPPGATSSYSIGGRSGVAIFAFDVPKPGRYRVVADVSDGDEGPFVLALGKGFGRRLVTTILAAIGIAFLSFVAAMWVAIATFIKRRRAARAALPPRPPVATRVAMLWVVAAAAAFVAAPAAGLHGQADTTAPGERADTTAPGEQADTTAPAGGVAIAPTGHPVPDVSGYTKDEAKVARLDAVPSIPGEETLSEGFVGPNGERIGRFTTGGVVWGWVVVDSASGRTQLLRDPSCSGRFTEKLDPVPDRFFPPECAATRPGVEVNPAGFPVPSVEGFTRDETASRRFDSLSAVPGDETFMEVLEGPDGSRVARLSTGNVAWAFALFAEPGVAASAYFVRDPDCDGTYTEKLPGASEFLPPDCAKAAALAAEAP